jgi:tRNA(adenine34) deaminase
MSFVGSEAPNLDLDTHYMLQALDAACMAEENGDVPIGCVIVHQGRIIARACNQREQLQDPTAHAEIIALTQASSAVGSWRLHGCTAYVTLEPCSMCAGALVLARIDRLVFACHDPKTGACGSLYNIAQDDRLNHRIQIDSGILSEKCSDQLKNFFKLKR